MIMRTINPVVACCMQISMYNFTGEAFVTTGIYRGILSRLRPCIVDSFRIELNINKQSQFCHFIEHKVLFNLAIFSLNIYYRTF